MKIAVVSYSLTGNNEALGANIAAALSAEHIKIREEKKRTTGAVMLDMIFNRVPKAAPAPEILNQYDMVFFVGPVWMGQAASPLRAYLKQIKKSPRKYAYISISGGALNDNPKLGADLRKRAGAAPVALIDQHITDLLPREPKPTAKDTSGYKLSGDDIKKLTVTVLKTLEQKR